MTVRAKLNNLRIAPRKVRLVANLIKGKKMDQAQAILEVIPKRAARPISKLLKSALADAENNFHLDKDDLFVSNVIVNEGRKLKRWRARSRGQAFTIQKKTSHVILELNKGTENNSKSNKLKKKK